MSMFRSVRLSLEQLEDRELLSTYFVSPTGSNSASGDSDSPWQTLQYAADRVQAGDTVIVRAGNYTGFELQTDGTAGARVVFSAEANVTINVANPVRGQHGINLEGADYVTVEGFTVVGMARAGIRSVVNHDVIIRNNVCDQNGYWGILTGFSDDLLIENNVTSRSVNEHGIYVGNSGDRPIIRNNTIWGNRGNGIHLNGDVFQGGDGIISGALVEGNIIFDNGLGGGSGINGDGLQDSIIRNNLLYNNHASGISLYRIDGGGSATNNIIANNTILQASDGRWNINIQNASTGNQVTNNILYTIHSFRGVIDISSDSLTGFTSDYNTVMNRFTTNGGSSVLTLAQWQTQTGQDMHSLIATPTELFVNPAANNYHLKSGSPAIDRGTSRNAPIVDLDGNARPSGAGYDIGAYEFQSAVGPAITGVSSSTANGAYGVGAIVPISVTFSGNVNVTGTPQLALNSGGIANYLSGSGTNTLTFQYIVLAGHSSADLDYVSTFALTLNGGTIRDAAGNNAVLTLAAPGAPGSLGANKNIVIGVTAPAVTNVTSSTANGTYRVGATIQISITFSSIVYVTGTPLLALNSGGAASYVGGSGTNTLTFQYTVLAGHNSADLDYTSTSALLLNGGTIEDAAGTDAVLTLPSPGTSGSLGESKNIIIKSRGKWGR